MSRLFQKREKLYRESVRWKKELELASGYLILTLWILFTLALLDWALMASFSTTKEIFSNKLLESGLHMENYVKAWVSSNVPTILFNSLSHVTVSCTLLVLICAPTAYALPRFDLVYNKLTQSSLVTSMGVPAVMIVPSLLVVVVGLSILNNTSTNRATLIFLYVGTNAPYTAVFLTTFFTNLSRAFEEAVAINGCPLIKTFWLIMLPMAQSGIVTITIFNFINIWNEYFVSLIFGNSDEVRPMAVGLYSMINSMRHTGDWVGVLSAVVIMFLPTLILYIFPSEKTITDVTGGGAKEQGEAGSMKGQGYII